MSLVSTLCCLLYVMYIPPLYIEMKYPPLFFSFIIFIIPFWNTVNGSDEGEFEITSFNDEDLVITSDTRLDNIPPATPPFITDSHQDEQILSTEASSSSSSSSSESITRTSPTHERCHWGTPECHFTAQGEDNSSGGSGEDTAAVKAFVATKGASIPKNDSSPSSSSSSASSSSTLLSQDMSSSSSPTVLDPTTQPTPKSHTPPEGYILAAHIMTDPTTGLSYFVESTPAQRRIPYIECGTFGSMTQPIPIKHATFQHFPHSATWSSSSSSISSSSTHRPSKLIVALSRLEITVSGGKRKKQSVFTMNVTHEQQEEEYKEEDQQYDNDEEGETRIFEPGDVILMEDFSSMGYKMRAVSNEEGFKDLNVLILTPLISHHHHNHPSNHRTSNNMIEKKSMKSSFFSIFVGKKETKEPPSPCIEYNLQMTGMENELSTESLSELKDEVIMTNLGMTRNVLQSITMKRIVLGSLGLTLSSSFAYFLSKVAPLQLAVGIGGTCLIVGGTWGIIQGGEWICDEIEARLESRNT